ncbi:MAG: alpha-glucosidase [Clostridia bacterium]|nr:alpha-glucosidase [Clostridia bacterium]
MRQEERRWWKEAVIYQIYPRSFQDTDGDGVGDLNGITKRLAYLQYLGVDAIWLCPIYASPNDDNGYDVSDYRAILPQFGTMADFERLLSEAHARGIRVLMDLVLNHTSDEHPWFVASRANRENPYRDYYIWRDPVEGKTPNNWGSCFTGPAWEWDEATGQYYLHIYSRKMPDLNWENPAVRQEIAEVARFWLDKGVDGFRLDSVNTLGKESYRDAEVFPGELYGWIWPVVSNLPRTNEHLRALRQAAFTDPDVVIVGETGGVSTKLARRYCEGEERALDMCLSFDHVVAGLSDDRWADPRFCLPELRAALDRWQTDLQGHCWHALYLSNHDRPRPVSRFGDDRPLFRERSAKMLATLLHMMRGTPFIYQGEELGMTNAYFERMEDYRDIGALNEWKQYALGGLVPPQDVLLRHARLNRDNARTPMQWSDGPNAGFSEGTPWIRVNGNYRAVNAEAQLKDENSALHYFRRLIALRHACPVIVYGEYRPLLADDPNVYAFERRLGEAMLTVLCNFRDRTVLCSPMDTEREILISNYDTHLSGQLRPYEATVLASGPVSSAHSKCMNEK